VVTGVFVHNAAPPVLKWVARARAGALATHARKLSSGLASSARCVCCDAPDEDDLHVLTGCPATGSQDCAIQVGRLWLQAAQRRGVQVPPLPDFWVTSHLLQLAVALIPASIQNFLVNVAWSSRSALLRDYHRSLAEWVAEVLRRREVINASLAMSSCSRGRGGTAISPVTDRTRQLTVAELRAAEQHRVPPPPSSVPRGQRELTALQRSTALTLHLWIKEHRHLRAAAVGQGEASVALLLLWEADHGTFFPCKSAELRTRVSTFANRLMDAVGADSELRVWLKYEWVRFTLTPGLPPQRQLRWGVRIDSAVGEPFLSSWKAHLTFLVSLRQFGNSSVTTASNSPRPKRPRISAAPRGTKRPRSSSAGTLHPQSKQARVERLRAALATTTMSSSTSSSNSLPGGSSFTASFSALSSLSLVSHPCGRAPSLGCVT
jgi:hypothetical protein